MKSHLLATPWLISTKYADPNRTSYRYNSVSEGDIVATSPYIFTQSLHVFDRRIMWPQLQISEKTQFTFSLVDSCPLKCNVEASWNWMCWCIILKFFLFAVIIVEINYPSVESTWHGLKILVTCVTVKCLRSLLCKLLLEILGVTKPVQFKETDREWKYCPKSRNEKIQSQRKMNSAFISSTAITCTI